MAVRKDRFLVGYIAAKNCVLGLYLESERLNIVGLMTITQARRQLRKMPCDDCAIFELVPVETNNKQG